MRLWIAVDIVAEAGFHRTQQADQVLLDVLLRGDGTGNRVLSRLAGANIAVDPAKRSASCWEASFNCSLHPLGVGAKVLQQYLFLPEEVHHAADVAQRPQRSLGTSRSKPLITPSSFALYLATNRVHGSSPCVVNGIKDARRSDSLSMVIAREFSP